MYVYVCIYIYTSECVGLNGQNCEHYRATAVGRVAFANLPHKDTKEKRGEGRRVTQEVPRRGVANAPMPGPTHGRCSATTSDTTHKEIASCWGTHWPMCRWCIEYVSCGGS